MGFFILITAINCIRRFVKKNEISQYVTPENLLSTMGGLVSEYYLTFVLNCVDFTWM